MVDSKFFGIPFAVSGDKATIPEAVQPSGAISYTQGFGPDYERDPATDPLAKRVPRDETNEFYYQVSNAIKFIQLYGTPEWYAVDDNGDPVSYPLSARVRYDAGTGMQAWRSLIAGNTATPGSDATKWTVDDPFSVAATEATNAEALAGSIGTKLITPRRLSYASQQGSWIFGTAAGTANALTVTLSPALLAYANGQTFRIVPTVGPSTAAVTLNVNGLGAVPLYYLDGTAVGKNEVISGQAMELLYYGGKFLLLNPVWYFTRLTPSAATTTSTFNAGLTLPDVFTSGEGGSVARTLSFTGSAYATCRASCAMFNQDTSLFGFVSYVQLKQGSTLISNGPYIGAQGANGWGFPMSVSANFRGLSPSLTYTVNLVCAKNVPAGPVSVNDAYLSIDTM